MELTQECAHSAFERHALRNADAVAVACGETRMGYGALESAANRLARHLRAHGIGPDVLVAICMARSPRQIEAVLAVLKAGGAYVPLDPAYPAERLAFMLADARPVVVLTDAVGDPLLKQMLATTSSAPIIIDCDADAGQWAHLSGEALAAEAVGLRPEHLAYVIYTSGSTGRPKGVMVPHRGLPNLQRAQGEWFAVSPASRVLQFASLSFDACVFEWSMALSHGASLHLGAPGEVLAGEALAALIAREGITHATLPPIVLSGLPDDALASVEVLICAGEALPPAQVKRWAVGRRMFNAYGPTETSIWSTAHACDPKAQATNVPIGRAIAGHRVHLLDERGDAVAVGDIGEIHIGGIGVARGYLHQPQLTAERFIDSSFVAGDRLYRTGDLARELTDGTLEYLGRNDFQVKIRGHRIELGEIEAALAARHGIAEAVAVARDDGQGSRQLVAYYRMREDMAPYAADTLRVALAQALPAFMLPSAYVHMTAWPLTPNGKLDRQRLPAPEADAFAVRAFIPPQGETEIVLAEIWTELLGIERIGCDDAFLALGGDSLKTIQLAPRIHARLGRRISVPALFGAPTLREMAALIERSEMRMASDDSEPDGASFDEWRPLHAMPERCPVSYQQYGLWLLEQLSDTSLAYNAQSVMRVRGRFEPAVLRRAIDAVIARHEIFRTTFHVGDDGEPYQVVHPRADDVLRHERLPADIDDAELAARIDATVAHRFELACLPLVRLTLLERSPVESVLIHLEQHYVHDGWSANLFLRELLAVYAALLESGQPALPSVPAQYRDYACWQRSEDAERRYAADIAYWQRQLAGAPLSLPMPTDFARPAQPTYRGEQLRFECSPELSSRLRRFCEIEGTTLFAAMQAVFQIVLGLWTGTEDFLVGSAVANRGSRKSEHMLGMFVNTIAIRADLSGDPTYRALLNRAMATLAAGYEHEEVPFERVVRALQPQREIGRNPLFQVAFSAHNSELPVLRGPGFELELHEAYSNRTSKFDFDVVMIPRGSEHPDRITVFWEYSLDLYRRSTIERISDCYLRALEWCIAQPDRHISEIDVLAPDTREHLIEGGYRPLDVAAPLRIHAGFEAHAARMPEAIALVDGEASRSYRDLNAAANRLAHHLRSCGVGPEALVAICQRKSFGLIESVLAVLKAGGAYLPLDSAVPCERLAEVLADATPAVVLTDRASRAALAEALSRIPLPWPMVLDVDADAAQWDGARAHDPTAEQIGLQPQHLAYVIYTSGSTGKPKGVMIEHRQIAAIHAAWESLYGLRPELRHLQIANPAFDVFTADLLRALNYGGTLVLCPYEAVLDGASLFRVLRDAKIDMVDIVPAVFDALVAHLETVGGDLAFMQTIVCGSDVWSPEAAYRARRACGDDVRLFNAYGLTEAAVDSLCHAIDAVPDTLPVRLPIGTPLPGVRVMLLDREGRLVPEGVAGEIHVGGAGVARGYLKRPELTAERFIDNPFIAGERLYRTGDLARMTADGVLEYLGRNDFQVKIRGHRIELGEIESRLTACAGVREAVVTAHESLLGHRQLVAYCLENEVAGWCIEGIHAEIKSRLPDYMVPTAYVRIHAWPLTPNGKIDRKALPAPQQDAYATDDYVAPRTSIERSVAELWARFLGLERVGMRDNFFALGGHSLSAMRLIFSIKEFLGIEISPQEFFETPTIEMTLEKVFIRLMEKEFNAA